MRNPTRRSQKIGLTQGGRITDGRASEKWSRAFSNDTFRKLSDANLPKWHVIRDNSSRDYYHPCTRADVHAVLKQLPTSLTECLRAVVMPRIPKEDIKMFVEARCRWGCIVLNPFPKSNTRAWHGKPPAAVIRHDEPWAGPWVKQADGQTWLQRWTREQVRQYYLYHLLLHELGHINDHRLTQRKSREAFAEDFALRWARRLGALQST